MDSITLDQLGTFTKEFGIVGYLGLFLWFFFTARIVPGSETEWRDKKIAHLEDQVEELQREIKDLLKKDVDEAKHQLDMRNAEFVATIRNLESYQGLQDSLADLVKRGPVR